ncbi:hypothetical protein, partial [Paenibacillus sinopodophylli]|uniref:hypothetical protein n=1 Tax=Paenibacillus sinopodophylli TaxID=1837342 RepID=UPI00148709A4
MKRIADRTSKAATAQSTSVQPFAGGILNKYKTTAGRNRFDRVSMSYLLNSQPSITQQTLHVQVTAPKLEAPKPSNKKIAMPDAERKAERIIMRERVLVERERIVFRDVTHVIKEQRTVREIAMMLPALTDGTAEAKQGVQPVINQAELKVQSSMQQLEKTVRIMKQQAAEAAGLSSRQTEKRLQSHNQQAGNQPSVSYKQLGQNESRNNKQLGKTEEKTRIQQEKNDRYDDKNMEKNDRSWISSLNVNRELLNGTIPQADSTLINRLKAGQQADYYKWLEARLQPGITIQSIRRFGELSKPLAKDKVQLVPAAKHSRADRYSPLQLTNARRALPRQEQSAAAVRQEAERSEATAGLEQREAAKRAEA